MEWIIWPAYSHFVIDGLWNGRIVVDIVLDPTNTWYIFFSNYVKIKDAVPTRQILFLYILLHFEKLAHRSK